MSYLHLDRDVVETAMSAQGTRLDFIPLSGFVSWPAADSIIKRSVAKFGADKIVSVPHLFIGAPPLCGVSSIMSEIVRRGALGSGRHRRAVSILTPHTFSELRVTHAIRIALQAPGEMPRGALQSERLALRALRDSATNILQVGKISRVSLRQRRRLLEYLYSLSLDGDVSLTLSGPKSDAKLLSDVPELAARAEVIELKAWPPALWVTEVVQSAIRRYPLRKPSNVTPEFMSVLFGRTSGYPGRVFGMLKAAARHAIVTGSEEITERTLREAELPFTEARAVRVGEHY